MLDSSHWVSTWLIPGIFQGKVKSCHKTWHNFMPVQESFFSATVCFFLAGLRVTEDIYHLVATLLTLFQLYLRWDDDISKLRGYSKAPSSHFLQVAERHLHMKSQVDSVRKAGTYCQKMSDAHPLVYSTLELGTSWEAVVLKMLGQQVLWGASQE